MKFKSLSTTQRYAVAASTCLAVMLLSLPLRDQVDVANIDMLFVLAVFASAIWCGRGPAVMAAFFSVALFDFFFIPPYYSFAVADAQYLITFAVMLLVGLITSQLVARLAERTTAAQESERQTRLLHAFSRELGVALDAEQAMAATTRFVAAFGFRAIALLPSLPDSGSVLSPLGQERLTTLELSFAHSAFEQQRIIEADTLAGVSDVILFLPLVVAPREQRAQVALGVLAIGTPEQDPQPLRALRSLLEAGADQFARTLDYLHQVEAARISALHSAEERLRTSILASLSHDLRTPLTSLVGLADELTQRPGLGDEAVARSAGTIRDQALAMHHMLSNLLEMARLQGGEVRLNKEWQPVDDVIGSSLRLLGPALASRPVDVQILGDLPLVCFDAVLIERVVCNLLENALKYSPAGSPIRLTVRSADANLEIGIRNQGQGFPSDALKSVFKLFVRGSAEMAASGTGMGLAICQAIVAAHHGEIWAENSADGATVHFTLPLGVPPTLTEESVP
ncbi:MAG: DUF4118 domain-containing protein [Rhodocyclaceae bacterium]|nr:DUF4118 domain-containing protein [Rhodocyclaceae bacterium]